MEDLSDHFISLPVRPPTPPKEFGSDDVVPIEQTFGSIRLQPETPYTPDESPASVNNFPAKSSSKTTKHVGFSPLSPSLGLSGYLSLAGPPRIVPPSRDCFSRKSILKSFNIQTIDLTKAEYKDVAEMLENFCRSLASQSKSTRLDAYMSLMNCLKVYKELPERELLESKVTLIADFIKRDMSTEAEDIVDTQIRVQSLKLLNVFLADPSLVSHLPYDFQCHILDRSIHILEAHAASKAIVNLHLLVLATQDFRSSIVTESKALDILAALEDLTDHVKGNNIVGFRLRIYQRLLRQSKQAMIKCVGVWTSHLFIGMLSNIKETRMQALSFGREASTTLGTQSKVSNMVQDTFNRQSPSGKIFIHTVIKRLNDMVENDDERTDVPHIWGIVVMFLRGRPRQLEHWGYMKEWMPIIAKCFNSSNSMVKHHASLAWNRLICAVDLSTWTSRRMIHTLKQPIKAQLERSCLVKISHRSKQMAQSSYCTLLYYGFRPQRPAEQLDLFWDEFVMELLMNNDNLCAKLDTEYVLEILTYLFDFGQPWSEGRAAEDPPIRPKDIPCLPPSWIHGHAPQVLRIFEKLIVSAKWAKVNDEDPEIIKAWTSFMTAIGRASGKEIRTSTETMNTVAGMMNCFRRLLLHQQESQLVRGQRILVLWKLANTGNIHPLAFTECRLKWTSLGFTPVVTTPSTRSDPDQALLSKTSAISALLELLCSEPIDVTGTQALAGILQECLDVTMSKSPSRPNTFKILRDVMSKVDSKPDFWLPDEVLWQTAIKIVEKTLGSKVNHGVTSALSQQSALDFQQIITLLELGLCLGFQPSSSWGHTLGTVTDLISQEVGSAGLAVGFIEPFASRLKWLWSTTEDSLPKQLQTIMNCTMALLKNTEWPTSQKELRQALSSIQDTNSKRPELVDVDPYDALYQLWDTVSVVAFKHRYLLDLNSDNTLLDAAALFLDSISQFILTKTLHVIQDGIVKWINVESCPSEPVRGNTASFWKACVRAIERLPAFDTATAVSLEPLLASVLLMEPVVDSDDVLQLWQNTFGRNVDLIVPESVSAALACVQQRRDKVIREPTQFDLDNVMEAVSNVLQPTTNNREEDHIPGQNGKALPNASILTPTKIPVSMERKQRDNRPAMSARHTTPKSSPKSRRSRHTPPKRLRHEDSQIVFAAIHSSPYDTEGLVSQFLTPHQREVRERQHLEANAMFPDIRSDPATRSTRKPRKAPVLSVEDRDLAHKEHDEWSSPITTKEPVLNDFVQSSPTPGPSRHASSSGIPEEGPPSSPPVRLRNRLAMAGPDPQKKLSRNEGQMEGVVNQEMEIDVATGALTAQDSDAELNLPVTGTRRLEKNQAMDEDDNVEPTLPELVGQRAQVTGGEIEKEIATKSPVSAMPMTKGPVESDDEQVFYGEEVAIDDKKDNFGEAQSNKSDVKTPKMPDTPMIDDLVSETDVYVDAPSSHLNTPKKDLRGNSYQQLRRNEAEQVVDMASFSQNGKGASLDVEDTAGSVATHENGMASRKPKESPTSSDIDEQVSQQLNADLEWASTQAEPARREDSTSDDPNKSSTRKRKKLASNSPEKPSRKSPRVVINRSFRRSQEDTQADAAVDEDGMLDCIVVATTPYQASAMKKATPKPRRESVRPKIKSRRQESATPSTSSQRRSSRLSQVSSRAGSFYSDEADERHVPQKASPDPGLAPADREDPNAERTVQSTSQDNEDRIRREEETTRGQRTDLGSPSGAQEPEEITHTSTANSSSSSAPSDQDTTSKAAGNELLLRLQNLVQEVKHVVVDREQQRRLLSTWMDLGQELHHADADSRAAKRT